MKIIIFLLTVFGVLFLIIAYLTYAKKSFKSGESDFSTPKKESIFFLIFGIVLLGLNSLIIKEEFGQNYVLNYIILLSFFLIIVFSLINIFPAVKEAWKKSKQK